MDRIHTKGVAMTDHRTIYQQEAERYDRLVMREDKDGNLLPAIQSILPLAGTDAVELGAGTGRLSTMLAPLVRSLHAFDASDAMLGVMRDIDQCENILSSSLHGVIFAHTLVLPKEKTPGYSPPMR
jgi:ubiquinone/menaquinone biosynthesis C-methylase UbiE